MVGQVTPFFYKHTHHQYTSYFLAPAVSTTQKAKPSGPEAGPCRPQVAPFRKLSKNLGPVSALREPTAPVLALKPSFFTAVSVLN